MADIPLPGGAPGQIPSGPLSSVPGPKALLSAQDLGALFAPGAVVSGRVVQPLGSEQYLLAMRGANVVVQSQTSLTPDSVVRFQVVATGEQVQLRMLDGSAEDQAQTSTSAGRLQALGLPPGSASALALSAFEDAGAPLSRAPLLAAAATLAEQAAGTVAATNAGAAALAAALAALARATLPATPATIGMALRALASALPAAGAALPAVQQAAGALLDLLAPAAAGAASPPTTGTGSAAPGQQGQATGSAAPPPAGGGGPPAAAGAPASSAPTGSGAVAAAPPPPPLAPGASGAATPEAPVPAAAAPALPGTSSAPAATAAPPSAAGAPGGSAGSGTAPPSTRPAAGSAPAGAVRMPAAGQASVPAAPAAGGVPAAAGVPVAAAAGVQGAPTGPAGATPGAALPAAANPGLVQALASGVGALRALLALSVPDATQDGAPAVMQALALAGVRSSAAAGPAVTLLKQLAAAVPPAPPPGVAAAVAAGGAAAGQATLTAALVHAVREGSAITLVKPAALADYDLVLGVPLQDQGGAVPTRLAVATRPTAGGTATYLRVDTELSHLGAVSVRLSGIADGPMVITLLADGGGARALAAALPALAQGLHELGLSAGLRVASLAHEDGHG
jgi:hypothetical protein